MRLVKLYQLAEVDDEWIKAQSGPLRLMQEQYETRLNDLAKQVQDLESFKNTELKLESYCERVRQNLDNLEFEEMRAILETPQIKVIATEDEAKVNGILGVTGVEPDLATTGRTLA